MSRPQLGDPHHHAYVVDDIEASVKRLVDQLGAGPFFLVESVPLENVLSRGEPAEFAHDSAFGLCGGGAIELIGPIRLAPERVEKGFSVSIAIHADCAGLRDFFEMVRGGAERWDGSEPLRRVES